MAGRGRAPRARAPISVVVAVCALLVSLTGCGGGSATDRAEADVRRLLDRRAAAVLDRDLAAYRGTGSTAGFGNLRAVPLAAWSYELTGLRLTGDRATADARLRYRVDGYDTAPVVAGRALTLARDSGGQWDVVSDRPAPESAVQPWDQGPVSVVHGERSLVLGVGHPKRDLRDYAGLADRAVPAVTSAWGGQWSGRVVVVVPESLQDMAALLGSPASAYRGIAAVTTGEVGAPARAAADRIIVNPDAYGVLGDVGRQVVLTHEATHVATRAHTNAATPLWLSEGYADWAGYRGTGRTPAEAAPELARAVVAGEGPEDLPTDEDFAFTGDAAALAAAYEGGWLACKLIAERWGEERLRAFYRAVGAHEERAGAVEGALAEVLDVTAGEFTERWREYLRLQFG
ncbi:hypothetical protein [Streptomyces sp. NPDC006997]|uniref:hypothetical protein n=1 Tax=Streptomyces sp. NPDC006997 TaxID=3155356 RepID=UPI0033CD6FE5